MIENFVIWFVIGYSAAWFFTGITIKISELLNERAARKQTTLIRKEDGTFFVVPPGFIYQPTQENKIK